MDGRAPIHSWFTHIILRSPMYKGAIQPLSRAAAGIKWKV